MNIEGLTKGEMFIWEWQYRTHGSFNEGLAKLLSIADGKNHKRLAKGFPDEAEAMDHFHHTTGWWEGVEARAEDRKNLTFKTVSIQEVKA
jgi:hypothetical protein|tara:strand:+ start:166 stop:435 length:270 start_codon:yes stop_codon:yes gene_type:complete